MNSPSFELTSLIPGRVNTMSRQKAATKARREMKRSSRKDRSGRFDINNVASFAEFTGIEAIGMAKERRDESPILPRNEAQKLYINSIKHKQLIFANGEAGCGKTYISTALAADALIRIKEVSVWKI